MDRLFFLNGPRAGTAIQLQPAETRLGRDPSCDVVIDSGKVSRAHATIRRTPDGYLLTDLRSMGGTRVNGQRVDQRLLRDNDVLGLGGVELRFLTGQAPVRDAVTVVDDVPGTVVDDPACPATVRDPRLLMAPPGAPPRLAVAPVAHLAAHGYGTPYAPPPGAHPTDGYPARPVSPARSSRPYWLLALAAFAALSLLVGVSVIGGLYYLQPFSSSRPSGKVLVSRTLSPSSAPQHIRGSENVSVTLPPGEPRARQTLVIQKVSQAPGNHPAALTPGQVYDISLGDTKQFARDLTIELPYDAARILGGKPDGSVVVGAWIPEQNTWQIVPAQVDATRGVVKFKTRHLCLWCVYYRAQGYQVYESANFAVVYDPAAMIPIGNRGEDAAQVAQRLASYLEQARRRYVADGFTVPEVRTFAFLEAGRTESERNNTTGSLRFAGNYDSMDGLRYEAAHELFHSVQNLYYDVYSMAARRWWIEATAGAAADAVWGVDAETRGSFRPTWFNLPLSTQDNTHEYATSLFLTRLTASGATLRGMWDAVESNRTTLTTLSAMADGMTPTIVLNPLEQHVYGASGTSLPVHYLDFVGYLLLDEASPYSQRAPLSMCARQQALPADTHRLDNSLAPNAGYTARAWGVTVEARDDKPRRIAVEATTAVPNAVQVGVFVVPGNARRPGIRRQGILSVQGQHLGLTVRRGDGVYVIAANAHPTADATIGLRIEDAVVGVTITPDHLSKGEEGKAYSFTARAEGIPEHVTNLRYSWDFGDGTDRFDGTVRPAQGAHVFPISHRWRAGTFPLSISLFDRDRPEQPVLGTASARVEIVPDDAGVVDAGTIPATTPEAGAKDWCAWYGRCKRILSQLDGVPDSGTGGEWVLKRIANWPSGSTPSANLVWTGNSFTARWRNTRNGRSGSDEDGELSGTLDCVTGRITTLRATWQGDEWIDGARRERSVKVEEVRDVKVGWMHYERLKGEEIRRHVTYRATYTSIATGNTRVRSLEGVDLSKAEWQITFGLCEN